MSNAFTSVLACVLGRELSFQILPICKELRKARWAAATVSSQTNGNIGSGTRHKNFKRQNLFFTIINTEVFKHKVMHLLTMMCDVETSNIPVFKVNGILLLH